MNISFRSLNLCPICDGNAGQLLRSYKTFVRCFDQIVDSKYCLCERCDFAFCNNPLSQECLSYYYQNNFQLRRSEITIQEAMHVNDQAAIAARWIPADRTATVLEIGADNGSFLELLRHRRNVSCFHDEINPDSIAILASKGIAAATDSHIQAGFDLVVLRHVFEHIPDPVGYLLNMVRPKLKDGCRVFIEVPDYSFVDQTWSDVFQFEHVNYFSVTSIHAIAKKADFTISELSFAQTPGYSTTPNRVMRVVLTKEAKKRENRVVDWNNLLASQSRIFDHFDKLIKVHRPGRVAIYGAGTHTVALLANAPTDIALAAIYDADPRKLGTHLFGHVIKAADEIDQKTFDLLLLTVIGYEVEVLNFLNEAEVPSSKILSIRTLMMEGDSYE